MSAAAVAGFSSCNEKWEPGIIATGETGTLSTESIYPDIVNAEEVVKAPSRAVDVSDFIVTVTNAEGIAVEEWTFSEMPGLPMFEVGNYTLTVKSHIPKRAAWGEPYFMGTKQFSITKDAITNIGAVTCRLQNVKVSVTFTDELVKASAGDINCEVRVNDEGVLNYKPSTTTAGYFEYIPDNTTMVVTFTGTVNGYKENIIRTYTDLKPGQHRIINYSLKTVIPNPPAETGQADPTEGLSVNMDVEDSDLSGNVNTGDEDVIDTPKNPGDEEWDDPEDPNNPDNPDTPDNPGETKEAATFTSPALDLEGVNPVTVSSAIVNIHCPEGAKNLVVTINSDNADFLASAGELMPLTFDLANPGAAGDNLASIGLPVGDDVIGKTDIEFNVTELVPLLGAFPGNHEFVLDVVDSKGNKSKLVLKFKAEGE